ncbi:helix-turn-helix domain-containing protein [Deinococcus cellulosilyticus]|uniref:Helix-turn-helix domain-containing protein n=1 Tax=Deinococcus cellulosilyticus (strain DSM 18568 / NBRC 106333 / KACC 11606 / 5516J-15) TaxID=1223518 RepID=A0A511N3Z8_DEIC1|nr:helix-turn-helix domain-containing protein [Deinococcus cellulosilyticus]GEM47188.1 hypothetical protein DC3_28230 [Deinococcus cellulosilyticus NBRC 106333 = KACC 11606]
MSIQIMTEVWSESKHKGSELLTLIAIADMANEHGEAYPSVGYIARKIRMTPRNTQKILQKLEASGELVTREGAGRNGTNLYRVITKNTLKFLTPEEVALLDAARKGGEKNSGVNAGTGAKKIQGGEPGDRGGMNPSSGEGVNAGTGEGANPSSPKTSVESSVESSVEAEEETTAAAPQVQKVQTPQNSQAPALPSQGPEGKPASAGIQTNAVQEIPGAAPAGEVDPETTVQLNKLFGSMLQDMLDDPAALVTRTDWFKIPVARFQELLEEVKRTCRASNGLKKPRTEMKFVLDAEVGRITKPEPAKSSRAAALSGLKL